MGLGGRKRRRRDDKKVAAFFIAAVAVSLMLAVMISFISHVASKLQQMRGASRETLSSAATALSADSTITTEHDQRVSTATFTVQRWTKRWALGCEKFLPGPAWLLLSKTGPPFISTSL